MMKFEIEWGYYLQAYRLQQGLTRNSNAESLRLLRLAIDAAIKNKRRLARGYGLLSFGILSAWLANWLGQAEADAILAGAIDDLGAVAGSDKSLTDALDKLTAVSNAKANPDVIARSVVQAYAHTAYVLDGSDYENHWSLATANLYTGRFADALAGYGEAQAMAAEPDIPLVGKGSLDVDFADARFFAGTDDLKDSDGGWIEAILEAIRLAEQAIAANANDPKRHRWYWTLGWAYYELAAYSEPLTNYQRSRVTLEQLRTPHDLIRKNLIATYAALDMMQEAAPHAAEFWRNNPSYSLAVEDRWPYRSPARLQRWKDHLGKGLGIA